MGNRIKCKAMSNFPESRSFLNRYSATGTVAKKAPTVPRKGQPLLAIKTTQKCKFLLTNVTKMDNEPGHERKVFILKVKTGSNLIPDEEVKSCDAPSHPPLHGSVTKHRVLPERLPASLARPPLESISQRRAVSAQLPQANKKHKETKSQEYRIPRGIKLLLLPAWGKRSTKRASSQLRHPSFHRGDEGPV